MRTVKCFLLALALAACEHQAPTVSTQRALTSAPGQSPRFALFESGPVRPIALSADGQYLYVCNTPDGSLEVLFVGPLGRVTRLAHVRVGMEPVAVALHGTQAWVVNHLSDDVSIVDVSTPLLPKVVQTLHVGDEPRDIVFAGPGYKKAFISTAHRGQNNPNDPQLQTPSVPRADVCQPDRGERRRPRPPVTRNYPDRGFSLASFSIAMNLLYTSSVRIAICTAKSAAL